MTGLGRGLCDWWASASAFSSSGRTLMRVLIYSLQALTDFSTGGTFDEVVRTGASIATGL